MLKASDLIKDAYNEASVKSGVHEYTLDGTLTQNNLKNLKPVAYLVCYKSYSFALTISDVSEFQKNHPDAILKPLVFL